MGGKKGGSGASPKEAPESGRSKQLVKIVEVISEGEVEGFVDGEKSIFFDNTPLRNADGSFNFKNAEWQARDGLQAQAILSGFNATEKEVSVSTEVKKTTPITRTITDPKVNRVRLTLGVSSLFHQNDNGDTNGSNVDFKITVGSRVHNLTINGKYSSQYLRNLVIDNLPRTPFTIKVERVQADSTSQRLQNKTIWASYTEIIDHQFTYPNTALIGIKFDSEYFSNIPTRTYDVLGIRVQVPSNYNPTTRQYSGLWDGSFKVAWTDNPAWILYDIVTNKRYGLGKRLGDFGADKWALYQVAQYCDQLVPDGFGNREPRFTCNVWLTEQRSAYDVINDICSIFRAMPVWNGTTLTVIQDRPSDPVWTYTAANVIGGFSRQYSAMKARHNAIQVEYKDKENNYETAIEYVSDDEAIRKYGLNLKKVQAFGCTSRGQAYRTGRWILETERLETETITFTVGAEGLMHLPGDIIKVADSYYAGTEIGGRVLAVSGRNVTLDREIQINGNSYLSFINANAQHSNIKISAVRGKVVTLDSTPTGLETLGVWSLTTQNISAKLYRAMSVAENEDGSYTITALQHEPQKEAIVDNGATFEPRATTFHQAPKIEHLDVAVSAGNAGISWQAGAGSAIVSYDVKILKDGKLYDLRKGLKTTELDLSELPDGDYQIIIISRNASGQILDEKSKTFVIDRPPVPQEVQVSGGLSNVMISWLQPDEMTQTEIWVSETDNIKTAKRVARVTANIYTHAVGAKQVRYYWVRHARGQNLGFFFQEQGLRAETGEDIEAEMALLNEKLREPLSREIVETALPARNLELVKTVTQLDNPNEHLGANLVYNQADAQLYRWNGTVYTAEVPDNSITAGKLAANSVTAGAIQTGAIRAEHIAAGEISADKLAIGLGGNLLYNPIFANDGDGWEGDDSHDNWNLANGVLSVRRRSIRDMSYETDRDRTFHLLEFLPEENCIYLNTVSDSLPVYNHVFSVFQTVNLVPERWYIFSCFVAGKSGVIGLDIEADEYVHSYDEVIKSYPIESVGVAGRGLSGIKDFVTGINGMERIWVKFKATVSNPYRCILKCYAEPDEVYPAVDSLFMFRRPMLEECSEHATAPSPWQNAGVTAIHGGSIKTDTITARQIAARSITAEKITAGAISAGHLAANSVTAEKLAAGAITAEKISTISLSAISANLGAVTAGTISGTTISGNTISGNTITGGTITGTTINGTTINGGTIKGVHLEGATGKFTGELEITQLIGGNVIEFVSGVLRKTSRMRTSRVTVSNGSRDRSETHYSYAYEATLHISAAATARYVMSPNNMFEPFVLPAHQSRNIKMERWSEYGDLSASHPNTISVIVMAYAISTNKHLRIN